MPPGLLSSGARQRRTPASARDAQSTSRGGAEEWLIDPQSLSRFESAMLPHLDAAHNLARWLTRDDHDAVDVVQESMLRALRGFHGFRGGDARAWLLAVVRTTCFNWMRKNGPVTALPSDVAEALPSRGAEPPALAIRAADAQQLRAAIEDLPPEFREAFVLRELQGLSYKEIAQVTGVPIGTVMSRLARARHRLQETLAPSTEPSGDLK